MSAALLAELRALGLELRLDGARLRVLGDGTRYSSALRAKILANKSELVTELRGEAATAAETYDRDERAWAAKFITHMARAAGYSEELVAAAASLVAVRAPRAPFRVEADIITIQMREGVVVRIHRLPQPWSSRPRSEGI